EALLADVTAADIGKRALEDVREIHGIRPPPVNRVDRGPQRARAPAGEGERAISAASVGRRPGGGRAGGGQETNEGQNRGAEETTGRRVSSYAALRAIGGETLRAGAPIPEVITRSTPRP